MTETLAPSLATFARADGAGVEWALSPGLTPYPQAVAAMEKRAALIAEGQAAELVWLLEHPPIYTAGVSARPEDLKAPDRFPVFATGRGGQYTYHGPGQRIAYVMLDLRARRRDARAFVAALEDWLILSLAELGVAGERRCGRIGVWVGHGQAEAKIAAIGVKLRRWVSFHGISLNIAPDLSHYGGIVPCGIADHGVTSLQALGATFTVSQVDQALKRSFSKLFGPARAGAPLVL